MCVISYHLLESLPPPLPPHGKTELISQLLMTNHFYLAFETWCDLSRLLQIPERDI